MLALRFGLFGLLLTTVACIAPKPADSGDSGDNGGDNGDNGGDNGGDGPTVYDVRTGEIAIGEAVTLEKVVVSSPKDYQNEGFFVQDVGGGEYSGIYVWSYDGVAGLYVEEGDEVTVSGTVSDYYGWLQISLSDPSADVTVTGQADVPSPTNLGAADGVDWEKWESVPVTLTGQTVESVNEYGVGLLTAGVNLDNLFENTDFDCRGSFSEISGIMSYSYEEWAINPRGDEDLTGEYTDAETLDTTVVGIQRDGVCGPVRVTGVVATTPDWQDDKSTYFFVQDPGGGEWSGVTVFVEDETWDVEPGAQLTIEGVVNEFYGLTELKVTDVDNLAVTGSDSVSPTSLDAAPADWEPYEGVLITTGTLTATSDATAETYGQCTTDWSIDLDDAIYRFEATEGDTWSSVTGAVFYSYSTWTLLPRSEDDFVE